MASPLYDPEEDEDTMPKVGIITGGASGMSKSIVKIYD